MCRRVLCFGFFEDMLQHDFDFLIGEHRDEIRTRLDLYTRSKMKPGFQIVAGTYSYM